MNKLNEESENVALFRTCLASLAKKLENLDKDCAIARNLACTEWTNDPFTNKLVPNKILPDLLPLLQENLEKLRSEISFGRYSAIKAFQKIIPKDYITPEFCGFDVKANIKYWDKELKKKQKKR